MAKVIIRSTGRTKATKRVDARLAEVLVRRGGWGYADAAPAPVAPTAPPEPDYGGMSYRDLRALAKERGLDGLGHATKEQLVDVLGARGHYMRRDMRASGE